MSTSLSSVVSGLVRAQMGSAVGSTVTDDDLDRHVAELILKEAKKKAERYGQQGIRAYISSNLVDSNAPKANKRFLTSIIKSTDDHNKTVLKAQALAAQEIKREREEQERWERRARAREAVEAEKMRRSGRSYKRRRVSDDEGWDRWDGRTAERRRKVRDWATWKGGDDDYKDEDDKSKRRRRHHSRSRSRERGDRKDSTRRRHDDTASRRHHRVNDRSRSPRGRRADDRQHDLEGGGDRRRHRRDRSRDQDRIRSQSPGSSRTADSRSPHGRSRREPAKYALDDLRSESPPSRGSPSPVVVKEAEKREAELRRTLKSSKSTTEPAASSSKRPRSASPMPSTSTHSNIRRTHRRVRSPSRSRSRSRLLSRSPTPGPEPAVQLPSKMDKYFEESYDPRLDVAPLAVPTVPKTGLINEAEYDGWDAMLELIRLRQQDREDKKVMERLGLTKEKKKNKAVPDSSAAVAARWGEEKTSLMEIEYTKRGAVREWDLGKAGF